VVTVLLLSACSGTHAPTAARTPASSSPSSIGSASASPSSSPGASPTSTAGTGPAPLVHCTAAVPSGDNLVIGTVVGDPTVVIRDIQDPAHAKNLCSFDPSVVSPKFIDAEGIVYETSNRQIVEVRLATNVATLIAGYGQGFDSGEYAVSPDGRFVSYIDGNDWRLAGPAGSRALTTLPALPGRGVSPNQDDSYLSYSPDGLYIALFQTFRTGGTGETAPDQIRRASDGSLVYSTTGMTMATWASVPSRLFFRDSAGHVGRWDPSTGVSAMTSLSWVRPRSSPDGRWIAYTFPTTGGVGGVGFYSVQANSVTNTTPPGRASVVFLNDDLVWYLGQRPCSTCFGGEPEATGVAYIYSIASASEVTSRLSGVNDAWPHYTTPGL
jgi:hypothetical protein